MSVRIPHRFLERLEYTGGSGNIRVIILGSFNPGEPDMADLPEDYRAELNILFSTQKYRRFKQVQNFYDRPPNRFWGIMDRINNPDLYAKNGHKFRNIDGLKFFRGGDRDAVFLRQQCFCRANGIFISDVVKAISTIDFKNVYNNFSDVVVNKHVTEFNSDHLLELIAANPMAQVIFNVKESPLIPTISQQLHLLRDAAGTFRSHWMPSTSGAAGGRYEELLPSWQKAIQL